MREMRSTVILAGALIGRFKDASFSYPGGCDIGARPIDLHLKAFKKLGINIDEEYGFIRCSCDKIKGANIDLDFPSVGATENIILATFLAEGKTTITNAAREPEIVDMIKMLKKMGANISGEGTNVIEINGVKESLVFDQKVENKVGIYAEIVCEDLKQKQEILEQIREINKKMPQYKNIKGIYITKGEILKTATGKIKRKEEINKVIVYSSKQNETTIQLEENDILESIKEILYKQLGIEEKQITTDSNIYDLGADSLDKVEIILAVEKDFNIKIPKEMTIKIRSVKDIMFAIKTFS